MDVRWAPTVLRDYALIADGERGVVVGPRGEMVWCCFPRWDSPALFASLIGGGGGYQVSPTTPFVWGGSYEPGSLIWNSRWVTASGVVSCREALALPGRTREMTLLRRVRTERAATIRVVLALRTDFGSHGVTGLKRLEDGSWAGRVGNLRFRWEGAVAAEVVDDGRHHDLECELRLGPGETHDLVLTVTTGEPPSVVDVDRAWATTIEGWRGRCTSERELTATRDVRQALAVLSGLTTESGAMAAAATMSLPERVEAGRNYDYRYAWIRDQCFVGLACVWAHPGLLDSAVRFIAARLHDDGPRMRPAYTVAGEKVPAETHLSLPGYPGGADIVGNRANDQFQLDAFGECLNLFAAADAEERLDADGWAAAQIAVDAIATRWHEPDAGIWELDPDEWTHSRLSCAAGLRAAARRPRAGAQGSRWEALADEIMADTARRALHPSGRWQRSPGDARVDAALLIAGIRGALPPDDRRTAATLHAVIEDLTDDGYAYRFRQDEEPLGRSEGAFLLCGFAVAIALLDAGDVTAASRWFERNRAACGPSGLFTEEYDILQRQLRGNLPQAFVHAMLIECAQRLTNVHA